MKLKHIALIFFIVLLIVTVLSRCGVGVSTDYPAAVMWNDTVYSGSGKVLSEDEVGNKVGSISKNVSKMPTKNGEANANPAGSNIFEIKGLLTNEAIAIEEKGQYRVFTSTPLK